MPDVQPILAEISKSQVRPLSRPISIDCVRDGGTYHLQTRPLVQTNLFLNIGRVDELFIKVPSARGFHDYRKFVKLELSSSQDIRSVEDAERFESFAATLDTVPALKELNMCGAEIAHYLVVHKLQYDRLRGQTAVEVPRAKFGLIQSTRPGNLQRYEPALFQERVQGTTLWNMFDSIAQDVLYRWQPFLSAISAQICELLDYSLANHIDWNLKNFVFDEKEERLFYVDLKPTLFVAKHTNEENLKAIRHYFLT